MNASADQPLDEVIEVAGYTRRYSAAVKHVLVAEGGAKFTNDPVDRGGATKFGISLRFLVAEGAFEGYHNDRRDFDLDMDGDIDAQDVRLLTQGDAIYLYHRCFWLALDCESFPPPIGEMLFDQGVNAGKTGARKLLQRAINTCILQAPASQMRPATLTVDGVIGKLSRERLIWVLRHPALGTNLLVENFRAAVKDRYRSIAFRNPSQKRFLNGWLARADRLGLA